MAYINVISEESAEGELKVLYEKYRAPWGGVDNILKIHSLIPETMQRHINLYRSLMFGEGPLAREQREMVATVVSKINECNYCIHHHGDALKRVTRDKNFSNLIRSDFRSAPIDEPNRCMLEYAVELTKHPNVEHSLSIDNLKKNGFSDEAILHLTLIIGYFNFVNRIALGLGVELEDYWGEDGYSDPGKPMAHDIQ